MSADLQFLEEWIPERMDPGTVFLLQNQSKLGMPKTHLWPSCRVRAAGPWASLPGASYRVERQ